MLVESTSSTLRLLITPLVEETFVGERFLDHYTVNLDVGLIQPVLIFVVADSGHELCHIESCACRLLLLLVDLVLLIGRLGLARALLADNLEDFDQLFLREVDSERHADVHKVVLEDEAQIILIVDLVGLLGRVAHLFDYLAELGHQRILLVRRLLQFDAAGLDKGLDQVMEADFFNRWLLLIVDCLGPVTRLGLDTLVGVVDRLPESFKLVPNHNDAQ